jgi:DNA-binding beta-propeller fold protein YncE
MYPLTHTAGRRRTLAAAGIATVALATAGTLLATSPADAATARPVPAPSIAVGNNPAAIAVDTYAYRAFVAQGDSIGVVDTQDHQLVSTMNTGLTNQSSIALLQAGAKGYVAAPGNRRAVVFNPLTDTVTGRVRVGLGTTQIVENWTTKGDLAYFVQHGSRYSRITAVDARTDTVVDRFHVAGTVSTAAQTPDLSQMWVGTSAAKNVQVLNAKSHKVVRTIPMTRGGAVSAIAFNSSGKTAFVTGRKGVTAVKVANGHVRWFMKGTRLFPNAHGNLNPGPVVTGPGNTVMVVNSTRLGNPTDGTVTTINSRTKKVVSRIGLGNQPTAMAADTFSGQVLVTNLLSNSVSWFAQPR